VLVSSPTSALTSRVSSSSSVASSMRPAGNRLARVVGEPRVAAVQARAQSPHETGGAARRSRAPWPRPGTCCGTFPSDKFSCCAVPFRRSSQPDAGGQSLASTVLVAQTPHPHRLWNR
jgi:hypothetical protein